MLKYVLTIIGGSYFLKTLEIKNGEVKLYFTSNIQNDVINFIKSEEAMNFIKEHELHEIDIQQLFID